MSVIAVLLLVLHALLLLLAAPIAAGLLLHWEARLAGLAGPPVLQPWRDLRRLGRKQPLPTEGATGLSAMAPGLSLAAVCAAGLLVPSGALGMASAPAADLLAIFGLLALARWITALAAFDAGTGPAGEAATHSLLLGSLGAPVLALCVLVLALLTGTTNLDAIVAAMRDGPAGLLVPLGLVLLALGMVALGDSRPLADPATGPAYSGRQLALVTFAAQLRLVLWLSLLAAVFLPFGMAQAGAGPLAWAIGIVCWALKLLALVAALGVIGAMGGRLGQARAQGGARHVLGVALLLALLAAVLLFVGQGLV